MQNYDHVQAKVVAFFYNELLFLANFKSIIVSVIERPRRRR